MKTKLTAEVEGLDEKNDMNTKETGHSFQDYYKRAVSPILVLKLLSETPMYSYQMVQELKKRSGGRYTVYLYPVTYRLLKQGYIKEHLQSIENGRTRNYYVITPEGQVYLEATLQEYEQMYDAVQEILRSGSKK